MKIGLFAILVLSAVSFCISPDELPHISVQEWGVITWSGEDPVVSSSPETPVLFPIGPGGTDPDGFAVRAPVLYFNGPEFTGSVTVKTDNGAIFDIYPSVSDEARTHSSVSWNCSFSNERIETYPDYRGLAPGEWNYDLWRVDPALTITDDLGWQDKFLYYETAPESVDFLPYLQGAESVCNEYLHLPALVIKRRSDGVFYSECSLGELVYGSDMEYSDIYPEAVMDVLFDWSVGVLEPEQMDALWRTWSSWILYDHSGQRSYGGGMVLYLVPAELTSRISTITVEPVETEFPVDLYRYILVAMPLQGGGS